MNAKEYLSQAFRLDERINSKLEQLATLTEVAKRATGNVRAKQICGITQSPMEDSIIRVIDLQHEINDEIDRLVDLKGKINKAIEVVKQPDYQLLLDLRYLQFKRWEEIAKVMKRSSDSIHYIHARALIAIKIDIVFARNEGTGT